MKKNVNQKASLSKSPNFVRFIKHWCKKLKKLLILLSVISVMGIIRYSEIDDRILKYVQLEFLKATANLGLKLENVYLEGLEHVSTEQVTGILNIKLGDPIFAIPINKLKDKLEQISWIEYAIFERRLPNTIYIGIAERKPLALWQNNGKLKLIDFEGKIIEESNLKQFAKLVILVGDDARSHASSLMSIITKDKSLYNEISSATRIGERRWNVRLHNKLEVKLPEHNPDKAWDYVIHLHQNKLLFNKNINDIDLRVENRLYIK